MQSPSVPMLRLLGVALVTVFSTSCATSGEHARSDTLTRHVGDYTPPPPGLAKPRVGVPNLMIDGPDAGPNMGGTLADMLTTLAFRTRRFEVIERTQLMALLDEQGLEGIVAEDELAEPGAVHGVDLLWIGKVTDFRVKVTRNKSGFGLGNLMLKNWSQHAGSLDYTREDIQVQTDCGVDLRLVDPSTGTVKAAHFGSFQLHDSASSMGVQLLGFGSRAAADLQLTDDDKGKVLRLALDDAVRKMLPDIDEFVGQLAQ